MISFETGSDSSGSATGNSLTITSLRPRLLTTPFPLPCSSLGRCSWVGPAQYPFLKGTALNTSQRRQRLAASTRQCHGVLERPNGFNARFGLGKGASTMVPPAYSSPQLKNISSAKFAAGTAASFASSHFLFAFAMNPKAPAGFALKEMKGNQLFSNNKVEVTGPPLKKELAVKQEVKRSKVTNEEKTQRMAGSWRSKLPSAQGENLGDEEKLASHDLPSTLKPSSNTLPEGGDNVINEHNQDATANEQDEGASPDRASFSTGSDDRDTEIIPLLSFQTLNDGPEDLMILPSDGKRESEEIPDHFYRSESEYGLASLFPKKSLSAFSASELEQDRAVDRSFTLPDSAARKLSTASEPLPERLRYPGDCDFTGEQAHKQPPPKNGLFEVQSHFQTPLLSRTTPPSQQTYASNIFPAPFGPQPLQTHNMYGSPVAAASRQMGSTNTDRRPEDDLAAGATLQSNIDAADGFSQRPSAFPPPRGFDQRVPRPQVQTPKPLSPEAKADQRMQQWALRAAELARPGVPIHGPWPAQQDIDNGVPANPLTWEQLVAVRKAEDALRASTMRSGLADPILEHIRAGHVGTGLVNPSQPPAATVPAFGQQHLQSSNSDDRIRDSGDRDFRDTRWERTLRPVGGPWAYDARFDRTRAQHVCRCALCQRMGKWFANPQPTHVVKRPPGL